MTEHTTTFQLINLLNPVYLFRRARTIRSFSEFLRRIKDLSVLGIKIVTLKYNENHWQEERCKKFAAYVNNKGFIHDLTDIKHLSQISSYYVEKNDFEFALFVLERMRNIAPQNTTTSYTIATIHHHRGAYDKALDALREALKTATNSDTLSTDLYNEIILIYLEQARYDEAVEFAQKSIDLKIADVYTYLYFGRALKHKKLYKGSIAAYIDALHLLTDKKPLESDLYYEIAQVHSLLEDHHLAIDALHKSIAANSTNAPAHLHLADSYKIMHAYDLGAKELLKALELSALDSPVYELCINGLMHLIKHFNGNAKHDDAFALAAAVLKFPHRNDKLLNAIGNEMEIAQRKTRLSSKVRDLSVCVTTSCNLNCIMCIVPKSKNLHISHKVKEEIVGVFPYLENLIWIGGEVFLYPDFNSVVREAIKHNVKQQIITSGHLLDEPLARELIQHNVKLVISIDGTTPEIYENIRRGARFDSLLEKLAMINRLKKSLNPGYTFGMNTVIIKSNYHHIESFADFAHTHGFSSLCFLAPVGDANHENILSYNEDPAIFSSIAEKMEYVDKQCKKNGIEFFNNVTNDMLLRKDNPIVSFSPRTEAPRQKKPCTEQGTVAPYTCFAPWKSIIINVNGDVGIFGHCLCDNNIGNLNKESMEELWNNQKIRSYREAILSGNIDKVCNLQKFYNEIPYALLNT